MRATTAANAGKEDSGWLTYGRITGMLGGGNAQHPLTTTNYWIGVAVMAGSQSTRKPRRLSASLWDRFHTKFKVDPESGCWLWSATIVAGGYGHISLGRKHKSSKAHRVAWELYRGEIPTGLCVLHRCDVPACVNPDHLYLGTLKDNSRDMVQRGRNCAWREPPDNRGERSPNAKLTDEAARHIARREMSRREYARLYGISMGTVGHIWGGRTWSSVTKP